MKIVIEKNGFQICKVDDTSEYISFVDRLDIDSDTYETLKKNNEYTHVIFHDGEAIGFTIYDSSEEAFIYIYIFPQFRHHGFGYTVEQLLEEGYKDKDVKIASVYLKDNEAAKRFIKKCGFIDEFSSDCMVYDGEKFDIPELGIRQYEDKDYIDAFRLSDEAFHVMRLSVGHFPDSKLSEPSEESRKDWLKYAEDSYVYVINDEIVGYGNLEDSTINSVSIKISQQGKGYGRNFVKYLTNVIIDKGKEKPSLWCVVGNAKARSLYESLGYKQTESITIANKKIN